MSDVTGDAQVVVRINEGKLLQNLRDAFSNRYTLVSELMQNARRAGASQVRIDYDEATLTLTVSDNGCGIDDFQVLFTFGESGWANEIVESEKAFGLGFTKSLYAATHCMVRSKGRVIAFDTAAALDRQPIRVESSPEGQGTTVILRGVELPELGQRTAELACGFPIRVSFNGVEQARPFAVEGLKTVECPVGKVRLCGQSDGEKPSRTTVLFLQGFRVLGRLYDAAHANIVHLDSRRFRARLPDRDVLIDAQEQERKVDAALTALWRERLVAAKGALSAEQFVTRYFDTAQKWGLLSVFDDVPFLPGHVFDVVADYPYQEGLGDADYCTPVDRLVSHEEITGGRVTVVELDDVEAENLPCWMVARARGWFVLRDPGLSEAHWIHELVKRVDHDLTVTIEGEQVRADLQGAFVWPTVVLCEAYVIHMEGVDTRITDQALYCDDRGLLLVPAGESSGRGVRQVSDYYDESDHWHDDDLEADENALADLIHRLRQVDPALTLQSLLGELNLERYPRLVGKCFKVAVRGDAAGPLVELVQ